MERLDVKQLMNFVETLKDGEEIILTYEGQKGANVRLSGTQFQDGLAFSLIVDGDYVVDFGPLDDIVSEIDAHMGEWWD